MFKCLVSVFVHVLGLFYVAAWEKVFPFKTCMCIPSMPLPSLGCVETFTVLPILYLWLFFASFLSVGQCSRFVRPIIIGP